MLRGWGLIAMRPGRGGDFASQPPQVRLGALSLWFTGVDPDPVALLEARMHLEDLLTRVAVNTASPHDVREMHRALDEMQRAGGPRAFFNASIRLHLAISRSARIPVLIGMYEAIVATLQSSLSRIELLEGHDEMYRRSIDLHREIVAAIHNRDTDACEKALHLHRRALLRATAEARPPAQDEGDGS
jgi:DNA-binding FadR family transcriptional regulator